MSVEQFRQLVREEVEAALNRYLQENRDIEEVKSAVSKTMSEYIHRTSKLHTKLAPSSDFTKTEVVISGKPIGDITVLSSEGLDKRFAALEARVKKRLDYLENLINP